jgi:hypothetical protein
MTKISILHLSDLHISQSNFGDQKVVLNALFRDIARM